MNKIISIIIATYNAEKYIERCLESIIPQKSDEIELIIVDGASTDNTLNILNQNKERIDVIISEPDKGLYDAWNKGIKIAKGQWIQFIGSDDIITSNALESYLKYLKNNEGSNQLDYISAYGDLVDSDGKLIQKYGSPYSWNIFKHYMNVSHGSSLHNRDLFREIGLYNLDYKICGDYELLLRKKENLKTAYLNENIIKMQIGGMSYSNKCLVETYKVKRLHNTSSKLSCLYYYFRGALVLVIKKIIW